MYRVYGGYSHCLPNPAAPQTVEWVHCLNPSEREERERTAASRERQVKNQFPPLAELVDKHEEGADRNGGQLLPVAGQR